MPSVPRRVRTDCVRAAAATGRHPCRRDPLGAVVKLERTGRGFARIVFADAYSKSCSLQKSSIADYDAIWLGTDDADPKLLIPGQGWTPVPFIEGTSFCTRMHLSREQVAELLPHLQRFVDTKLCDTHPSHGQTIG